MGLVVFEYTPFPRDLSTKIAEEISCLYKQGEEIQYLQLPKAVQLIECTRSPIGVLEKQQMVSIKIATFVLPYIEERQST